MINTNVIEVAQKVEGRVRSQFRGFPVTVYSSPDDTFVLCVRVFAVPKDRIEEVEDFVFDLQNALPVDSEVMLLPMVKDLAVTRQHYPEHMSAEPAESAEQMVHRLLRAERKPSQWHPTPLTASSATDCRTLALALSFDLNNIMGGQLQPRRTQEIGVAANSEMALAA